MRILIETSGGGGVVLLIGLALLMSHGGGVDAMVTAVLAAVLVAVVAAVLSVAGYLLYRARRQVGQTAPPASRATLRAEVLQPEPRTALAPPQVRLDPDQLAELAALIRSERKQ
jgi:hypothetical protein